MTKRGEISRAELAECSFRGGFELGYQRAVEDLRRLLATAEGHIRVLEKWALGDPTVQIEPPELGAA